MASPAPLANGVSTPPTAAQPSQPTPPTTQQSAASNDGPTPNPALPSQPGTSLTDGGGGKRPRDARLIHLLLSSLGVKEYQDRVPLQLMDFAYRYTAGVLGDALALSAEGYGESATAGSHGASKRTAPSEDKALSTNSLKLAIASRAQYQFQGAVPKEFLLEVAADRNKVPLPRPEREFGVRLPPERYCFTGVGWGLKDEWESEGEEHDDEDDDDDNGAHFSGRATGQAEDKEMGEGGIEGEDVDQEEFEEVMGVGGGNGEDRGGDQEMAEG